MSDPESVAKWLQIRDNSLSLHRLGENPGQILRWSADKSVHEVSNRYRGSYAGQYNTVYLRIHEILCKGGEQGCKPRQDDLPQEIALDRVTNVGDIRMANSGNSK